MEYFFSIFIGTFVLEDFALASALALMSKGQLNLQTAFLACFLGITIGDLGLYLLGSLAFKFGFESKFNFFKKYHTTLAKLKKSKALTYSIVASRVIPGTRLPTYLAAGLLGYPFLKFLVLTLASVAAWVLLALLGGKSIALLFMDRWLLTFALCLIFLQILKTLTNKLSDPWQRKSLIHFWRKWLHFEFWPAAVFYIPLVLYYLYLSVRFRNPFLPFYASPHLRHGGLIGESKWDFLRHLDVRAPSTLKALKVKTDLDFFETKKLLLHENFDFPFIVKPDVGQRGYGVRIIRNDFELTEYLLLNESEDLIFQRLSLLPQEAGVFYIRKPSQSQGYIFSITDKRFPFVIGDGKNKLGDLILQDQRARIIAETYFARLQQHLDTIPKKDERIVISECGNHCQGAIFLNGHRFITNELTQEIDRLAKQIPDFYFGRFDIRYKDTKSLMQGRNFEIVEINGSGSEATHIWDANTQLLEAYRTLFIQWRTLFEIGREVQKIPEMKTRLDFYAFLKECAKVAFRKDGLTTSS